MAPIAPGHPPRYELTRVRHPDGSATLYDYDENGNTLFKSHFVPDTVIIDAQGEVTIMPGSPPDDETGFGWDQLNRLTSARRTHETPAAIVTEDATFQYAGIGWQMTSQTVNNETRTFNWSPGGELLSETITSSPAVPAGRTRTYINGGLDKVLWSIDSAGPDPTKFWNTDLNGSVFALANSAGSVIERQRYDAYGNTQITDAPGSVIPGSTIGNQTGFQGRSHIPQFGISQFRHRWYMPQTGTFMSRDPLGMIDGPAVYAAFGGDPVGNVDPMGQFLAELFKRVRPVVRKPGPREQDILGGLRHYKFMIELAKGRKESAVAWLEAYKERKLEPRHIYGHISEAEATMRYYEQRILEAEKELVDLRKQPIAKPKQPIAKPIRELVPIPSANSISDSATDEYKGQSPLIKFLDCPLGVVRIAYGIDASISRSASEEKYADQLGVGVQFIWTPKVNGIDVQWKQWYEKTTVKLRPGMGMVWASSRGTYQLRQEDYVTTTDWVPDNNDPNAWVDPNAPAPIGNALTSHRDNPGYENWNHWYLAHVVTGDKFKTQAVCRSGSHKGEVLATIYWEYSVDTKSRKVDLKLEGTAYDRR